MCSMGNDNFPILSTSIAIPTGMGISQDGTINLVGSFPNGTLKMYNANNLTEPSTITLTNNSDFAVFLVKYSPTGIALWATMITNILADSLPSIATDCQGNIIITGQCQSNQLGIFNIPNGSVPANIPFVNSLNDTFIIKYSMQGYVEWATKYAVKI